MAKMKIMAGAALPDIDRINKVPHQVPSIFVPTLTAAQKIEPAA
jgi:hypothetical protein